MPSNATSEKPRTYRDGRAIDASDVVGSESADLARERRLGTWMVWGGVGLAIFTISAIYVTHRDEAALLMVERPAPGSVATTTYVKPIPF